MSSKLLLAVLAALISTLSRAQKAEENFPEGMSKRVNALAIGSVNVLDTYLSPENYMGTSLRFLTTTQRMRTLKNGKKLLTTTLAEGELLTTDNRADNNNEIGASFRCRKAWRKPWDINGKATLSLGGATDGTIGFLYNTRNQNNPAQAYAALSVGPSVGVAWNLRALGKPVQVTYDAYAPLLGLMFSPNYGQSYYEIFSRGNYDHNIVPTTIIATPSLNHQLCVDFELWQVKFRVGYLGDYQQSKVNNLKRHQYTHALMVGLVKPL